MKKLFLVIAIALSASFSFAQDYQTAVGVRGGFPAGLTVKHFLSGDLAVEGLLHSRWGGFGVTGLLEKHAKAFDVDGLNWYYGGGGHIGFYTWRKNSPWDDEFNGTTMVIGVDGILGLEYNIGAIPINISVDWKPTVNFVGLSGPYFDNGALSVRYTF